MSDENKRSVASTGSVSASVSLHVDNSACGLPKSRPLRRPGLRLTDAERQAIADAISCCEDITYGGAADQEAADVLKALLERTK